MKNTLLHLSLFLLPTLTLAQNQAPVVSNVSVNVPWNSNQASITFDLSDAENDPLDVKLEFSNDGGQHFVVQAGSSTGDIGFPITPGNGKTITWNFDTISNIYAYSVRVIADDKQVPSIQELVDAVDSSRLHQDLTLLTTGIRHYQANPSHLEAMKDTIEQRFIQAGLQTRRHEFLRAGTGYMGHNIIGRKPGLGEEAKTYYVDAHFDSVEEGPGADDNGSGVVGFLEVLRVLAPYNFSRSIRFIGFDFEESVNGIGTYGSLQYTASQIPSWEQIEGVANYEMIGYYTEVPNTQQVPTGFNFLFPNQYAILQADSFRGNFVVNVGDTESEGFELAYDSLTRLYVPDLKIISLTLPGNGLIAPDFRRSDHANFWDINTPAVMLSDGANFRNLEYHTPADTTNNLDFGFMANIVKGTVATIATLAGIQHSSYADADIIPSSIPKTNAHCPFGLFPNPTQGKVRLDLGTCFFNLVSARVYDMNGKEVHSQKIAPSKPELDLSGIPNGSYFVALQSENNTLVKRVQVQK
jgi:hypothetical protein